MPCMVWPFFGLGSLGDVAVAIVTVFCAAGVVRVITGEDVVAVRRGDRVGGCGRFNFTLGLRPSVMRQRGEVVAGLGD